MSENDEQIDWHKYFRYHDGDLIWKMREGETRHVKSWNTKYAGKVAGCLNGAGYTHITLHGKLPLAHRIVWEMHNGTIPEGLETDHVNGKKTDDRLSNLRVVTHAENMRNRSRYSANTSGVVGVHWSKGHKAWMARIALAGKLKYLGCFTDKAEAIAARRAAEVEHGFHENHGRVDGGEA